MDNCASAARLRISRDRYRDRMNEINTMLDAMIGPLNVTAGYVDRISKGDIPPKITDNYNGDFNDHQAQPERLHRWPVELCRPSCNV